MKRLSPWIAAAAGAALVLGTLLWVRADRRAARDTFPAGSIHNEGEEGTSLAFAYLAARAGKERVGALTEPLRPGAVPAGGTVFRLAPTVLPFLVSQDEEGEEEEEEGAKNDDASPGAKEAEGEEAGPGNGLRSRPLLTAEEEEWVRGGGRLVLGLAEAYGPVVAAPSSAPIAKVFPLWPGVRQLAPDPVRALSGPPLAAAHAVFLAGQEPVVSRLPLGEGEVIVLAVPEMLANRRLGTADHLPLLEALAGVAEGRAVRFDEHAHGAGGTDGPGEILAGWGLGPFLLLLAAAAGVASWRAAMRLGPPDREPRALRSDAVELVDSLADLYDRALGRGDAVRLYYDNFVHTLGAETGLAGEALSARARQLAPGFVPPAEGDLPPAAFEAALAAVNDAFRRWNDARHR